MQDQLGNRMKEQYEDRTRYLLPRRTYTIIRIDGKAFHTYCSCLDKPFDQKLMDAFEITTIAVCKEIQGVILAYLQSDEVSFLITDFDKITTEAWFNGNLQKLASVSASLFTAKFNKEFNNFKLAVFDSRAFTIPDRQEVINYLIWRQNDCTRNSILSVAQNLYSHKEMENKNCSELQEMIFQKNENWNNYTPREKRGTLVFKRPLVDWVTEGAPIFTQERNFIEQIIPHNPNNIYVEKMYSFTGESNEVL